MVEVSYVLATIDLDRLKSYPFLLYKACLQLRMIPFLLVRSKVFTDYSWVATLPFVSNPGSR